MDYGMATKKKGIDTGKFVRIYKGQQYNENPSNNMGLKMCLEGTAISKKKTDKKGKTSVKPQEYQMDVRKWVSYCIFL